MSQKFDASTWTGLTSNGRVPHVRDAQNPVAGAPLPLSGKKYHWRLFNWSVFMQICLMWGAAGMVSGDWSSAALPIIAAVSVGGFAVISIGLHFWSIRQGNHDAIRLSANGLHMPNSFAAPIPWRYIGWVEPHLWRGFRMVSVQVAPEYRLQAFTPWPMRHFGKSTYMASGIPQVISCWAIEADCATLIADIRRYRDNYCVADAPP